MLLPGFIKASLTQSRDTIYKSEKIRVMAVSFTGIIAAAGIFLRVWFSVRGFGDGEFPIFASVLVIGFVLYEIASLRALRRRLDAGRLPSKIKPLVDSAVEGLLPFGIAFSAILDTNANPFVMVSGPLVLGSLLLIVLSVLRLNPWLSLVSGVCATVSYIILVSWVIFSYPIEVFVQHDFPQAFFPISILLLAGGSAMTVVISVQARTWLDSAWVAAEQLRDQQETEREMQLASEVQRALLPREWPVGGVFEIAASSCPAMQLGGDFYDCIPLPKDRVLLSLADVTGHGAASAILGAEARAYLRASSSLVEPLPELIQTTESFLLDDLSGGRFVTMLLVNLDNVKGALEVYSAGQGPVYVLRNDGSIESLPVQRPPLGVVAPGLPEEGICRLQFAPGDLLVAVSDGVLDRTNPAGESFGEHSIMKLLSSSAGISAEALVDRITRATEDFSVGTPAADDASIMIVRHA